MGKKYSIHVEDDRVVSVEVDGVEYSSPEQIPNRRDRARVRKLIPGAPGEPAGGAKRRSRGAAEADEAQKMLANPLPKFLPLLFLGVAVLLLAITAFSAAAAWRALARETTTPGRVADLVGQRFQDGSTLFYPVIQYTLPDGRTQIVQLSGGSYPPAFQRGQAITVAFDPALPLAPRIKTFGSTLGLFTLPLITGFLAAAFAAATLFARWIMTQGPTELDPELREFIVEGE